MKKSNILIIGALIALFIFPTTALACLDNDRMVRSFITCLKKIDKVSKALSQNKKARMYAIENLTSHSWFIKNAKDTLYKRYGDSEGALNIIDVIGRKKNKDGTLEVDKLMRLWAIPLVFDEKWNKIPKDDYLMFYEVRRIFQYRKSMLEIRKDVWGFWNRLSQQGIAGFFTIFYF